jgi:hypothetical protein
MSKGSISKKRKIRRFKKGHKAKGERRRRIELYKAFCPVPIQN